MKIVWGINWHRWILGVVIDRLTVAVFIGPISVDFLYRWDDVQEMLAASREDG